MRKIISYTCFLLISASCLAQTPADTVPKKRFVRAAGELLFVELLPWSYDRFVMKADFAKVNFKTISNNLKPSNWTWDDDKFKTNQFGHPYHGNLYFSSFRSNGYSFWQSAPAAFSGSLLWEIAGETNRPAANDLINTTLGGISLGEMTYRLSRKIVNNRSTGVKRQAQEFFGFLVNPLNGLNRIANGEWGKIHGAVDTNSHIAAFLNVGVRHFNIKTLNENIRGRNEIYLRLRLNYGDKYEISNTPFESFYAQIEAGSGDSTYLNTIQINGALKTWELKNDDKSAHLFTVTMNYDFLKNNAFQYGGQSFTFKLISNWNKKGPVKLHSEIGSGFIVLGAVPDKYLHYNEGRNYDYGQGINFTANATVNIKNKFEAEFNYKGSRLTTSNGNPSSYILNTLSADARVFFCKRVSVAAGVGQYTLNGFYKGFSNVAEVYPFARFSLGYNL